MHLRAVSELSCGERLSNHAGRVRPDGPKDLRIQRLPVGYASEEAAYVDEVEDVRPVGPW